MDTLAQVNIIKYSDGRPLSDSRLRDKDSVSRCKVINFVFTEKPFETMILSTFCFIIVRHQQLGWLFDKVIDSLMYSFCLFDNVRPYNRCLFETLSMNEQLLHGSY